MALKLFTGITFFCDPKTKPVKLRNISSIERHIKYIENKYPLAHYTNYYHKEGKGFSSRVYHMSKEDYFKYIENNKI